MLQDSLATNATSLKVVCGIGGSPRHYLIWTHGDSPLTSRRFTPVLVDAETGKLTAALSLPWYLKTLELSRPLHFGDYGGMPMKIFWASFDIVAMIVLGSRILSLVQEA